MAQVDEVNLKKLSQPGVEPAAIAALIPAVQPWLLLYHCTVHKFQAPKLQQPPPEPPMNVSWPLSTAFVAATDQQILDAQKARLEK
jgi:hypothetical protein